MTSAAPSPAAPWTLFAPHANRPWAFFLDRAGEGVPSFAGSRPSTAFLVDRLGGCRLLDERGWHDVGELFGNPLDAIDAYVRTTSADPVSAPEWLDSAKPLPRTVGYLAYELGRFVEHVPVVSDDAVGAPFAVFATYDRVDVWDPEADASGEIVFRDDDPADRPWLPELEATAGADVIADALDTKRTTYARGFGRVLDGIRAGEIYQANLSRRIVRRRGGDPAAAYEKLRDRQPVPHGAYLDLGHWKLLSNSPECFIRIDSDTIRTYPIKGTRPRSDDPEKDSQLARELAADEKERAEHLMIVDLERNDLGRVCEIGSVAVPRFSTVESFETLHHLVSEVRGTLRTDASFADVLRATFPGGSITGAPKVRSMEIIAEVEDTARGVYTGAIGFANGPRSLEFSIAIRTAIAVPDALHYSTGGGIVADSGEESEWNETITKARAFLEALGETVAFDNENDASDPPARIAT